VCLLAVLVFVVTFAMNYLGGPSRGTHQGAKTNPDADRAVTFITWKDAPLFDDLECEVGTSNSFDYWFVNENDQPVVIGASGVSCQSCSAIEAFILPAERRPIETALASALASSAGGLQPMQPVASYKFALGGLSLNSDVKSTTLLRRQDRETVSVPAHTAGWIRMHWKQEKAGHHILGTKVWMNDKNKGIVIDLQVRVFHHDPIRVRNILPVATLTDETLARGVTEHILVWSSTRRSFKLQARPATVRGGNAASDPFEVGTPVPLTPAELTELFGRNNAPPPEAVNPGTQGHVLSGYKVPVTFRAMSSDGKSPFDIGLFRRGVVLTSPDVDRDPLRVQVVGRVRGLVELGHEDEGGSIDFGQFARRDGASARPMQLLSSDPDVTLELDRKRTPAWLTATLKGPTAAGEGRRGWTLYAKVIKGQVSGSFPRAEDPLYEDSAIYLRASTKAGQTPRPIRIAVRGTANES
jgi:hypothetical protein